MILMMLSSHPLDAVDDKGLYLSHDAVEEYPLLRGSVKIM
jgi:hypothetical protein